jgi:tetratricopeptide (TPR) repeat protein
LQKARETGELSHLAKAEWNLLKSLEYQRNFEAIRSMAFLYLEMHRFPEALQYAKEAVDTVPADMESQGVLADAYLALGNTSAAETQIKQMMAAGESFAALGRMANLQHTRGNRESAALFMRKACMLAEHEGAPPANRAWCYSRLATFLMDR